MKSRRRVVVPALITFVFAAAPAQAQQELDWSAVFLETVVDERPERISCPTLEYPRELQAADIQGSVLLRFVVDTMGLVEPSSVKILSSTHEGFERPATTMIRDCRFRPGRVRSWAVRTRVQMPINFTLTAQAQSSALQGAWIITEVSVSTPDTSWTEANPQPGLYVFLGGPRRFWRMGGLSFSNDPTDAERLAPFGPFVMNSGAYEVSGGPTLTIQPLVALYPNAVSDNSEYTSTHRVEGDTLRLTLTAAWAEGGEVRYTLARRR